MTPTTKDIIDQIEINRAGKPLGIPKTEIEALYNFIKENNIKRVIETGVCYGISSAYILAALPEDGHLFSIESNVNPLTGSVIPDELRYKWHLISSTSQKELYQLFLLNPHIDLFLHDSDHHACTQCFEFETALPFVKYIASHDITLYDSGSAWRSLTKKLGVKLLFEIGQLGICQVIK